MADDMNYDERYFGEQDYHSVMSKPRLVFGRWEPPLAQVLADMVASLCAPPSRVLDLGCAHGYVVAELVRRGYDARGIESSEDCINASVAGDRVWCRDVTDETAYDEVGQFDLAVAANLYEHLDAVDAARLSRLVLDHSRLLLAIVNKSDHDPTHITLRSNRFWRHLITAAGWRFHPWSTMAVRSAYLRRSQGTERWHRDALVFGRADGPSDGAPLRAFVYVFRELRRCARRAGARATAWCRRR